MRNFEEFNNIHKDRICFVIGAGPSIYFQDLNPLKQYITIAVNSGYVAANWSTYFVSDDWSVANWSYFHDLKKSQTIVLLYENKLLNCASWFGDRSVLFRHCKGINIPDKYEHNNVTYHLGETRTSLGTAIMVAHVMGCHPIVVLGLDCCRKYGQRYFWQLPVKKKSYKTPYRCDGVPLDRYKKCKINGQITDRDLMDIRGTWEQLGKAINKKCVVYNTSEDSIITIFPKRKLEDFFK